MISNRIKQLAPSATLMMSQLASQMKAQGIDVINLSVGEPDFPTPEHISLAAKQAIDEGYTRYTPIEGYLELRKAIVRKLQSENNLTYSPDQIVVSGGGKQAVCNAILSLIEKDDEVIIPAPYWVSYPQMVLLAEGKPVIVETTIESNYCLTAEQLEAAITPRTKLLILCSPSNPTGSVYSKQQIDELHSVISRHDNLYVISDEIYEHIIFNAVHHSLAQYEDIKDRVIIANGVSKAYAMTGWRIGWIAANKQIAAACKKLQGQYTSCPSSVAQKAAEAAYNAPQDCVEEMRQEFEARRNLCLSLAKQIPNIRLNEPQGAFYLLIDISAYFGKTYNNVTIHNAADIAQFLLETGRVTTVEGGAFGANKTIRISYAASQETLTEAFRRIRETLALLK